MTFAGVRRLVIGQPLATAHAIHQRLPRYLALSVFGADPISSSAYATEEILLALVLAGSLGLRYAAAVAVEKCGVKLNGSRKCRRVGAAP